MEKVKRDRKLEEEVKRLDEKAAADLHKAFDRALEASVVNVVNPAHKVTKKAWGWIKGKCR